LSSELRQQLGWTAENIVLGMVANFRACKRHVDFVTAARELHSRFPQTRFVLVGNDRGVLEQTRAQVSSLALTNVLAIITGNSQPERLYPAFDICVCTSETEGFSNVLLEAMACAKPLIATAVGGNPEAIDDGVEGILIPAHRPDALVTAAAQLIEPPSLRRRMGQAGRVRVEARYSLAAMTHGFEEVYLDALDLVRNRGLAICPPRGVPAGHRAS
jgi:glycosyltransferase involved in cell wall biosynthesis